MFCTVETKRKPLNSLKFRGFHLFAVILRGATGIRTRDTRIFSPLLYQLSYGTNIYVRLTFIKRVQRYTLFSYLQTFSQKIFNLFSHPYHNILIIIILQPHRTKHASPREIGIPRSAAAKIVATGWRAARKCDYVAQEGAKNLAE